MFNARRHPLLVTMGLAAVLTLSVIAWLSTDDESQTFLYSPITKAGSKAIKRVEMQIENGTVVLNITLVSPLTCLEIYKQLGIEPLSISGKLYEPTCSVLNPSQAQIRFREATII